MSVNGSSGSSIGGRGGWLLLASVLFASGCGGDSGDSGGESGAASTQEDDGHSHEAGPHGGAVVILGDHVAHVEFIHDDGKGRVDLYIQGADGTTPLAIADAPAINLKTGNGPVQVKAQPVGGGAQAAHFEAVDPVLKSHGLNGQIAVKVLGKDYFVGIPEHDHEDDPSHVHAENTVSLTAWTAACEWFVELETPEVGKAAAFAAHVTLLDGFKPAPAGTFSVEAKSGPLSASALAEAPARPGIFTPDITFLCAGEWTLVLTYTGDGVTDVVEWPLTVHEPGEAPEAAEESAGDISFLKEQQWEIPFATVEAATANMGAAMNAVVVPAGAVVAEAGSHVVYVQTEGETFERRVVETGDEADGLIVIVSGVTAGERVVTTGMAAVRDAGA